MGRLSGKVAVITGAGSGIGLAATKLFAQEGAKVLAVDLDESILRQALETVGEAASPFAANVTEPAQVAQAMAVAERRFGGIDILLPNAAVWDTPAPIEEYSLDTFTRSMAVNVTGVFLTMKCAIPYMVKRGGGSIVITSSVAAVHVLPNHVAYHTSKHALTGLMRVAAVELAPMGIRVNTVNPGLVDTPMMALIETQFNPENPEQGRAEILDLALLKKRYVSPEEVAELMLYLASDKAQMCTGALYMIDGGQQISWG
jgi:NAD(P)-dependent dehydrogenase (short-subunit alcohol dehydrogenase family)